MNSVEVENSLYKESKVNLVLEKTKIDISSENTNISIKTEQIKKIELFRSIRNYCLRIYDNNDLYDIYNIHDNSINKIKAFVSENYGINLSLTEIEVLDTVEGNFLFNNNILTLQNSKPIFSIHKSDINKILEIDNEFQFNLDNVEIVFNTNSSLVNFISNTKTSDEICILNNVNCINPRSKCNLIFFNDYFECRGSSYDHNIFYNNINDIFYLSNSSENYLVLRLENFIMQGQTKYDSLIFLLDKKEIEVPANSKKLKEYYRGEQSEVFIEILEALLFKKVLLSHSHFKCVNKVNEGHLFLLESGIQFLPKSNFIPLSEISCVEFSRINISATLAKTFDMTIYTGKVFNFNCINKEKFNELEVYFNNSGIKVVSEVIEDDYSVENETDEQSDISGIIASED